MIDKISLPIDVNLQKFQIVNAQLKFALGVSFQYNLLDNLLNIKSTFLLLLFNARLYLLRVNSVEDQL